jgi:hypothetical protein
MVFAAGAAVALALLIGLGLSTWLFFRERDAHERESRLRAEAEDRSKITQAVMLVSQGKYHEADRILGEVKSFPANPTLDCASAFRSVGEWQALQGHWQSAAERYTALVKIDNLDTLGQVIFDYQACSALLAETGDQNQYWRVWQMAVTNFAATPNGSVLLACILMPLNKSQIEVLQPMVDASEKQVHGVPRSHLSEWTLTPIALWQYRCGNYGTAIQESQRSQALSTKFPCTEAILHAILAMSYYHDGQSDQACAELAQSQQLIDEKFRSGLDRGRAGFGYWYDWVYARHLEQEAAALLNCDPGKSAPEH